MASSVTNATQASGSSLETRPSNTYPPLRPGVTGLNLMTLKDTYDKLCQTRDEYLERGYRSAILTVPSLLPRDGTQRHRLPQNFQSVGARGINNLSSKLMLTLFPPTLPFMRLKVGPAEMKKLTAEAGDQAAEVQAEIEASLSLIEKEAIAEFNIDGWRPALSEAMRQAVCVGNVLIYDRPGGKRPATYDIRRYVVERDNEGTLLKVVLRQMLSEHSLRADLGSRGLDQEAINTLVETASSGERSGNEDPSTPQFELHTGAELLPSGKYNFWQEIGSVMVPGSMQEVAEADLPLIPLRFQPIYGASYGRGYVEDYDGDLLALESISRALVEGSLAMAKILWLVKPGGTTKARTLAESPNGAIRQGDGDDVSTLQSDKSADLNIAYQMRNTLQIQLSNAFLLNSSVQRAGERVTAEEIRFVAQELEDALGGVYSSLSDTVQAPIVFYIFNKLKRTGKIGALPKGIVPVVATGLEAISRNHEIVRTQQFLEIMERLMPDPNERATVLKTEVIAQDTATGLNLDKHRVVRSSEEIAALREQAQQQAAVESLGPNAINQLPQQ